MKEESEFKGEGKESSPKMKAESKQKADNSKIVEEDEIDFEVIERVKWYFFENDEFANFFEGWVEENCHQIEVDMKSDLMPVEEELKLEYTALYNTFLTLFEAKIEKFLEREGFVVIMLKLMLIE